MYCQRTRSRRGRGLPRLPPSGLAQRPFTIRGNGAILDGSAPVPDTLKDGAQALADGRLGPNRVFRASQVQAKCASKYETQPGQAHPANIPIRKAGL